MLVDETGSNSLPWGKGPARSHGNVRNTVSDSVSEQVTRHLMLRIYLLQDGLDL